MNVLANRRIILAVTGGIAAYKIAELIRRLKDRGAEVRVVMTASACAFITPLTLQALSGQPVHTSLLDPAAEMGMGHIELARWADYLLVAPATANTLAHLAHGWAADLLGALWLATSAVRCVAPAMNQQMWAQAATQRNMALLRQDGVQVFGPGQGEQACGDNGWGRLLEPAELLIALETLVQGRPVAQLAGVAVVVTAGPTRERLDPVRYLSNFSSGKMGYALAQAFVSAGACVTLVSGPVHLPVPEGVRLLAVESAEEMLQATLSVLPGCAIFVGTAAVADYRPKKINPQKIKKNTQAKNTEALCLELEKTTDILATVAAVADRPFVVGFAAETENAAVYAQDKLKRKKLDMIACNDVSQPGTGFASDENILQLYWEEGERVAEHLLPRASKTVIAQQLVEMISKRWKEKKKSQEQGSGGSDEWLTNGVVS